MPKLTKLTPIQRAFLMGYRRGARRMVRLTAEFEELEESYEQALAARDYEPDDPPRLN